MVTVNYTKKFTSGVLLDLEYESSISFPSRKSAQKFIDAVFLKIKHSLIGESTYTITRIEVLELKN
jgi:hypothetical protein